jgi:hypothetical protein
MTMKIYSWVLLSSLCFILGPSLARESWATTIYSYIDDRGNPVFTDAPDTIPEKYRAKVKTHEDPNPVSTAASKWQSARGKIKEQAKSYGWDLPSFQIDMAGLSQEQSKICTYAGAAAILLLLIMYVSKGQLVRISAFFLLVIIGISTPVLMYISDGGPMDIMKNKAAASGQAQQNRLQHAPQ